ncbi:hypothetical protein [Allochromatium tepidum]|uniref:Uncharacterized protein n=1 Tax=Allochromatium tepidum TaxID=553982 RepID=A0ABM7QIF1_9GAMM|nr:hypothetical protein [Allochromatium tepidum]BCU05546.1 hypothetical protein Atep_02230 [Allochromatium tepidum]
MSESNSRDLIQQDIDDSRRDGLSLATALVIRAEESWIGVGMEYEAIRARHGRMHEDWTPTSQRLLSRDENGRSYDQVNIVLSDGRELSYFFDITDFYGREVSMTDDIRAILEEDDAELDSRCRGDEDPCFETAVVIRAETIWSSLCEETIRNPSSYFRVKLDMAATARLMRYPEAEVMWAEVVVLAHQYFERKKARAVLAEALVRERAFLREWNDAN